jgi:tRNA threonylcarbamoyladenosine biosynthesis protein TsaE
VRDAVSSPTFSIINEYAFEEHGVLKKLYHIDLYRLQNEAEVVHAGIEDCLYSGASCFVEWPEKAKFLFDDTALHVFIEPVNATERRIKIVPPAALHDSRGSQPS